MCQIVAEELKIPVDEIQVIAADTETTPVDIGSWISGNAYVTGNATRIAATEVRKKLLDMAAEEMEDVDFSGFAIRVGSKIKLYWSISQNS